MNCVREDLSGEDVYGRLGEGKLSDTPTAQRKGAEEKRSFLILLFFFIIFSLHKAAPYFQALGTL